MVELKQQGATSECQTACEVDRFDVLLGDGWDKLFPECGQEDQFALCADTSYWCKPAGEQPRQQACR